jgi:hypothetical protein
MAAKYASIPPAEPEVSAAEPVSHQNYLVRSSIRLFFCCCPTKEELEFTGTRILRTFILTLICYLIFRSMINILHWNMVITMSTVAGCILTVVAPYSVAPCIAGVVITYQRGPYIENLIACTFTVISDCAMHALCFCNTGLQFDMGNVVK